ncbi:MAG TPA: hypothetical protein VFQ38_11885 [Longimicrobiales bacterium]|nr:hypothetical protein [Longimicrobiales bacterium]
MNRILRGALALAVSAAALLGLEALSRYPVDVEGSDGALLRLSWRVRSVRVEHCRKLTPEELEALPAHMRQPERCEGRLAPYDLVLSVDGRTVERSLATAAGARADRPVYVYRDIPLAPGAHRVRVEFVRRGGDEEEEEREEGGAPRHLSFDAPVTLAPGQIALVTYDAERRALVLRGSGGAGAGMAPGPERR